MEAIVFQVRTKKPVSYHDILGLLDELGGQDETKDMHFQVIDASVVKSENHLLFSVAQAIRRHHEKRGIASNIGIEVLLFLLQTHQIRKAIKLAGIHDQVTRFYVVGFHENESVLDAFHKRILEYPGAEIDVLTFHQPLSEEDMAIIEEIALFNLVD